MGRPKKYNTEEERKNAKKESWKKYSEKHKEDRAIHYKKHREQRIAYQKDYSEKNRNKIAARFSEYLSTPKGRATCLCSAYKRDDKKYNRGECTIDAQWIVDNVFSGQVCHYCGESDWKKLGADRKDSSLPHTPNNCVPCCCECNKKKHTTPYDEYMRKIGKIA